MGTPWVQERLAAIRWVRSRDRLRKRYVVMVWPATVQHFVMVAITDSKRAANDLAVRWYPKRMSRGSFVYDRRARRVILDTHATEIAKRWASRLVNYA